MLVLDTSAFLAGFDPFVIRENQVTSPKVQEELSRISPIRARFETAIENRKLVVKNPAYKFLDAVKTHAKRGGDYFFLSETDLEVLALALELKQENYNPKIVSDDYSIQNVATQIGVEFISLATFGIRRSLKWERYCPACYRKYSSAFRSAECIVCGTKLKRKPLREVKTPTNHNKSVRM